MAYHKYCSKSSFGCCEANESELKQCPYLQAISEIARLVAEQTMHEDDGK